MYESAKFILGDVQPTVYSFENAPTLYTGAGDSVRERLVEIAKEFGYSHPYAYSMIYGKRPNKLQLELL